MAKNARAKEPAAAPQRVHRMKLADVVASAAGAAHTSPLQADSETPAPTQATESERPTASSRAKYTSVTVYLPPRAIRLIKEIGLEDNRRLTDILAEAVDEYLTRRGHPSITQLRG